MKPEPLCSGFSLGEIQSTELPAQEAAAIQTIIEYGVVAIIAATVLIRVIALIVFSRKNKRR
jgi:hypothetical protein